MKPTEAKVKKTASANSKTDERGRDLKNLCLSGFSSSNAATPSHSGTLNEHYAILPLHVQREILFSVHRGVVDAELIQVGLVFRGIVAQHAKVGAEALHFLLVEIGGSDRAFG